MHPLNVHPGPAPNPLELRSDQVVLSASIHPDRRPQSTGGFHLTMTVEHLVRLGLTIDPRPVETYETIELAEARAMRVAAECSVTDMFLEKP